MFSTCTSQGTLVLPFTGRLDSAECERIEAEVLAVVAASDASVVFDLRQVDFISSAFLRICVRANKEVGARGFGIANSTPVIKRVFKIAGLEALFNRTS